MTIWRHLVDQPSCGPSRDSWTKSPARCIRCCKVHSEARLAQSAERKALNLVVVGLSPTVGVSLGQPVAACSTDAPISQAAPFKHHAMASDSVASGLSGASSCRLLSVCGCWALAPVPGGLSTGGVWHICTTRGSRTLMKPTSRSPPSSVDRVRGPQPCGLGFKSHGGL